MVTSNSTNSKAVLSFRYISSNAKNLSNAVTYSSSLCEFFHSLLSPIRVSGGSSFIPLRASLFVVVFLVAITAVSDSHSCASGDFLPSKFLLVACLGLVAGGGVLDGSDSLLLTSELLSLGGPAGSGVVLVLSSSW